MLTVGSSAPYRVTQRVPTLSTTINATTTSAAYVDVDAVNAAVTLTTLGGSDLLLLWHGMLQDNTGTSGTVVLAFSLDGAAEVCATSFKVPATAIGFPYSKAHLFQAVGAGAHTCKLRWRVTGGDTIQIVSLSEMIAIEYRR
jgi:hypothetical protein